MLTIVFSLAGGAIMFVIGICYLAMGSRSSKPGLSRQNFSKDVTASEINLEPNQDLTSRNVIGVQASTLLMRARN